MNRGRKKPPPKPRRRREVKKEMDRLIHEAVQKVVSEYGDVLRKLGKE